MAKKSGPDWGQIILIGILGTSGLLIVYGYTQWVEQGSQGNPVSGSLGNAAGFVLNPMESALKTAGFVAGASVGTAAGYTVGKGIIQSDTLSNFGTGIADWFGNIGSKLVGSNVPTTTETVVNELPVE